MKQSQTVESKPLKFQTPDSPLSTMTSVCLTEAGNKFTGEEGAKQGPVLFQLEAANLCPTKMATFLRRFNNLSSTFNNYASCFHRNALKISSVNFCTARVSYDDALTIADYVEQKRSLAKLGGGQRRIDNQHRKVGCIA